MALPARPLAIVTGASAGMGYEIARQCATQGFDLIVSAGEPTIQSAAHALRSLGARVNSVQADLATLEGVGALHAAAAGRPVDALLVNGEHGLGRSFLDQDVEWLRLTIDTYITGTMCLIHKIACDMRARGRGQILIGGSIAGVLESFSLTVQAELEACGVTITCLMPGSTTTAFFDAAVLLDGGKTA